MNTAIAEFHTMLSKTVRGQIDTLIRFGLVGALTAGIYALVLALIVEAAGQPPALGAGIAYVLAVSFNYWAHHEWTYRTERPRRYTGPRYFVLTAFIFCINVAATAVLPGFFGITYLAVQVGLATGLIILTYVAQNLWIFPRGTS